MSELNTRETVDRYLDGMQRSDPDAISAVLHEEYVEDYPQSGERIRGAANLRGIIEHYPGGEPQTVRVDSVIGTEDRWVVTPSFTPVRIEGAGDQYVSVAHIRYPDGSDWHVIQLIRLKDGKVYRITSFYAAPFEAPAWRAPYVERIEPG